jgi:hypothetical protein
MAATRGTDCRVTNAAVNSYYPREVESPMVDFTDAQKQWLQWLRSLESRPRMRHPNWSVLPRPFVGNQPHPIGLS